MVAMMKNAKYFARLIVIALSLSILPVLADGQTQGREQRARLIVSFSSICCGINHNAREKLDNFISNYEKMRGRQLAKATVLWGREGEIDYCLKLSELSSREQKRFIARVRSLLRRSKLVQISENTACRSGR